MNGFSVGGEFHPLTVTDRLTAEPPAFGVALAHVWPASPRAGRAGAAGGGGARDHGRADVHAGPRRPGRAAGDRAGRAPRRRPRRGALRRGARRRPERAGARRGARRAGRGAPRPEPQVGGACVRFLVAPEGELAAVRGIEEAEAVDGVQWARVYRRPGHRFGPLRLGPDRAGAVLAVGGEPRRGARERGGRRLAHTLRHRSMQIGARRSSASSRRRSARRRSRPSRRRSARAG